MMTDVTITIEGLKATTLPTLFQNPNDIGPIETSAYGKPQTPKVVERAEKIATYRSILDLAGHASIGSFVSFLLFGTGLSLIRRSIRNRLDKIYSLIDTSNDEHGDQ